VFGYLYQDFALIETDTAQENVELPLRYSARGVSGAERRRRARAMLDELGLTVEADRPVAKLSGGQRQRVGLARALANTPPVILADEPTGALDSHTGADVFELLLRQARAGHLVIVATHDIDLASACDRVIAMRDGLIVDTSAILPRRAALYQAHEQQLAV
jgi:macrolide transport system ATP-binding/permease protein